MTAVHVQWTTEIDSLAPLSNWHLNTLMNVYSDHYHLVICDHSVHVLSANLMKSTKVLNPRHHHLGLRLAAVVTQSAHRPVCMPK